MTLKTDMQVLDANIADAIHACAKAIGLAVVDGRRTCLTCLWFDEKTEQCSKAAARPPARVIAFGCPAYEEDIPF